MNVISHNSTPGKSCRKPIKPLEVLIVGIGYTVTADLEACTTAFVTMEDTEDEVLVTEASGESAMLNARPLDGRWLGSFKQS
jgi:hypothetical protein